MDVLRSLADALIMAGDMFWEVLWPLVLGFALSGVIQAVVSHRSMARLLGDDSPRSLGLATLFGTGSSSCSYAAVAIARSIFQKGASFTSAMVFEMASTNLVIEPGIILVVLLGWPFAAAEFTGGILMVLFIAVFMTHGDKRTPGVVRQVDVGGPAWEQGLRSAARILRIGRVENPAFEDLLYEIGLSGEDQALPVVTIPRSSTPR